MANRRALNHGVRCPRCGGHWVAKDGNSAGRQVWRCGECRRRFPSSSAYRRPTAATKEQARKMRRAGLSCRTVADLLGVSAASVSRWTG